MKHGIKTTGKILWNKQQKRFETGEAKFMASVKYPGGGFHLWNLQNCRHGQKLCYVWPGCEISST